MPILLDQAIAALQAGNNDLGQALLAQLLKQDVRNEQAWLLLAQCVPDDDKKRTCLERVLALNPGNDLARQLLNALHDDHFQPRPFEFETQAASAAKPSTFESALARAVTAQAPVHAPDFTPEPFALVDSVSASAPSLPEWIKPPTPNLATDDVDTSATLSPDFYVPAPNQNTAPEPLAPDSPTPERSEPPGSSALSTPAPLHPSPLASLPPPPNLRLSPDLHSRTSWLGRPLFLRLGIFLIAVGLIGLILPNLGLQSTIFTGLNQLTGILFYLIAAGCFVAGILILLGVREQKP